MFFVKSETKNLCTYKLHMNELRKCRALLLAQQQANIELMVFREDAIVRLEEHEDSLDVVFKKGEFFAYPNDYVLSITKHWHINISWSNTFAYSDKYADETVLAMRAFMREWFPDLAAKGEIISCGLFSPRLACIKCGYTCTERGIWWSHIQLNSASVDLPVDICLNIIVRAMRKFNLHMNVLP